MMRNIVMGLMAMGLLAGCVTGPGYYSGHRGHSAGYSYSRYPADYYGYGQYGSGYYGDYYDPYGSYGYYPYPYGQRQVVIVPVPGHTPQPTQPPATYRPATRKPGAYVPSMPQARRASPEVSSGSRVMAPQPRRSELPSVRRAPKATSSGLVLPRRK